MHFPDLGGRIQIALVSRDKRERFSLDVNRKRIALTTTYLISRYYEWLKNHTAWREINGWVEITTPYLDRHNDYIQIYLASRSNQTK